MALFAFRFATSHTLVPIPPSEAFFQLVDVRVKEVVVGRAGDGVEEKGGNQSESGNLERLEHIVPLFE